MGLVVNPDRQVKTVKKSQVQKERSAGPETNQ